METKTYRAECKATEEDGIIDAFIPMSTPSVDRDEEVIQPQAFKKSLPMYLKRPILLSSHNYSSLTNQIGEFTRLRITEEGVVAKPKYYINEGNEEADWAYQLAKRNMAAFSVGFIPRKWDDGDGIKAPKRVYTEVELLEVSQVCVPSNRDAIQGVRSKSVDPVVNEVLDKVLESDLITKPEETENYIRIPVSEGHGGHRIRTITISDKEGIKALYCGECKKVITYLFSKEHGWTMEKARAWVKEHEKAFVIEVEAEPVITNFNIAYDPSVTTWIPPEETKIVTVSQEEIKDDIDYLVTIFDQDGVVEKDTIVYSWKLVSSILKQAGDDIPEEIRTKLQPIDIAKAVKAAFAEVLGGK